MRHFKVILAMMMMAVSICASAQTFNYGVEAGYAHTDIAKSAGKTSGKSGFKVGGVIECTFDNNLSYESGLSYVRKGGKEWDWDSKYNDQKFYWVDYQYLDYLQIPLTVGYKFYPVSDFCIKPQAGIYAGLGICGKAEASYRYYDLNSTNRDEMKDLQSSFNPYKYDDGLNQVPITRCNRPDYGISLGLSAAYKKIALRVGYNIQLNNVTTNNGNGRFRTLSATLAYWFK